MNEQMMTNVMRLLRSCCETSVGLSAKEKVESGELVCR